MAPSLPPATTWTGRSRRSGGESKCAKTSPESGAAFSFWHPDLVTMHLWLWYPNPDGVFNGTNPLIAPFNR